MKLITVEAPVVDGQMTQALQVLRTKEAMIRKMTGCAGFSAYQNDAQLAIIQTWDSQASFDAYCASEVFAGLGEALKPLMRGAPVTRIAEIDNPDA